MLLGIFTYKIIIFSTLVKASLLKAYHSYKISLKIKRHLSCRERERKMTQNLKTPGATVAFPKRTICS